MQRQHPKVRVDYIVGPNSARQEEVEKRQRENGSVTSTGPAGTLGESGFLVTSPATNTFPQLDTCIYPANTTFRLVL
jgi:hypothetical protein